MCLINVGPLQKPKTEIKAYKLFGIHRGRLYSAFSSAYAYYSHNYPNAWFGGGVTLPSYKLNVVNQVLNIHDMYELPYFNSFRYFEDAMEAKDKKFDSWAFWTSNIVCLPVTISNDIRQGQLKFANKLTSRIRDGYPAYLSKNLIVHVTPEAASQYSLEL
jgi:hypothetical protein